MLEGQRSVERTQEWAKLEPATCETCGAEVIVKRVDGGDHPEAVSRFGRKAKPYKSQICLDQRLILFRPEITAIYAPPNAFVDHWWPAEALLFFQCERGLSQSVRPYEPRRLRGTEERMSEQRERVRREPAVEYLHSLLESGPISAQYVRELWLEMTPWNSLKLRIAIEKLGVREVNGCFQLPESG